MHVCFPKRKHARACNGSRSSDSGSSRVVIFLRKKHACACFFSFPVFSGRRLSSFRRHLARTCVLGDETLVWRPLPPGGAGRSCVASCDLMRVRARRGDCVQSCVASSCRVQSWVCVHGAVALVGHVGGRTRLVTWDSWDRLLAPGWTWPRSGERLPESKHACACFATSSVSSPSCASETADATGPADASSSTRLPPGGHPPPRPGAVRHAVGGRVRADQSATDSGGGEEGEHTLFVYIPEGPRTPTERRWAGR